MPRSRDQAAHPADGLGSVEVADEVADRGRSPLARISSEVVKTFKEYFGKGPTSAKSYMVDDLLFVAMRDGLTEVETFLLEQDEADVVRQYRQTFGNHMDKILSDKIEALTARKVVASNSQVLFSPDMSVEIFVFADSGSESIDAITLDQISEKPASELAAHKSATAGSSGAS